MKHLHNDERNIFNIERFLKHENFPCWRFRLKGGGIVFQNYSETYSLAEYLHYSNFLWGDSCLYGIYFGRKMERINHIRKLVNSIEHEIDLKAPTERIAFVGYVDGGLISITNRDYPWLEGVQEANWWAV